VTQPALVTGGTGTLGGLVVPRLRASGLGVRVLSRRSREAADGIEYVTGDLLKNEGIDAAVDGREIVVHLAGGPKGDDEATRTLVRAAERAGVKHLVLISVIGADRMPLGYFRAKLGAERAVGASSVPWTVLRAAQFHGLVFTLATAMARLPVVPIPRGVRFQPVDARDVAERIVELSLAEPSGLVPALAGPREYDLAELVGGYLKARGKRRPLLPLPVPGRVGRAYRAEANLAVAGIQRGTRSWERYLIESLGRAHAEPGR